MDAADELIAFAAQYQRHLDRDEAEMCIVNQARLADHPDDAEAQRLAHHFAALFYWCRPDEEKTIEDFINDPRCPPACPECRQRHRRYAERSLAEFREAMKRGAAEK